MQQQAPQPKNTPGRRRQGRQGKAGLVKSYASENDVAILKREKQAAPTTPQKGPAPKSNAKHNRSNNRKQNRRTPPCPGQDEDSAPIFAGGTFHASPAPSALPMPSFLRKSTGESPLVKSRATPTQEPSPPSTDSDEAHDPRLSFSTHKEESPLDILFKADRAEKTKVHRASSASATAPPYGPFSPPNDSPRGPHGTPQTMPRAQQSRPNFPQRGASSGISAAELDGTPGQPFGPAFSSMSYNDRIRAALGNAPTQSPLPPQSQQGDRSDELKRLLGVPLTQQGSAESAGQYSNQMPYQVDAARGLFSSPAGQGYASGPSMGGHHATDSQNTAPNQVSAMEDRLRRVLKLDSSN